MCEELPYCFLAFSVYISGQLMSVVVVRPETEENTSTPLVKCDSGNINRGAVKAGESGIRGVVWVLYES